MKNLFKMVWYSKYQNRIDYYNRIFLSIVVIVIPIAFIFSIKVKFFSFIILFLNLIFLATSLLIKEVVDKNIFESNFSIFDREKLKKIENKIEKLKKFLILFLIFSFCCLVYDVYTL